MKTLITEQKFLTSLMNANKCEDIDDFIDFLKNDFFGYNLICDFKNIEEYKAASERNPLWEILMDKYDEILFNSNLSEDIIDDSFYENLGEQNIFLINQNENICSTMIEERGYLYLSINNLPDKWKQFKKLNKGLHYKITNSPLIPNEQKLNSWTKLKDLFYPLTSLVIFDKYLLVDKTDQKLANNFFPLLKLICKNSSTLKKPLNITIITEFDSRADIEKSHIKITDFLKEEKFNNVHINILKHNKMLYPRDFEGLHSRFILSNYFHFRCDASFNFFKSNSKINNDADLRIDFSLSKKHRPFFKKELNDIKLYITKLNNNPKHPSQEMRILYCNDLQNYLLS